MNWRFFLVASRLTRRSTLENMKPPHSREPTQLFGFMLLSMLQGNKDGGPHSVFEHAGVSRSFIINFAQFTLVYNSGKSLSRGWVCVGGKGRTFPHTVFSFSLLSHSGMTVEGPVFPLFFIFFSFLFLPSSAEGRGWACLLPHTLRRDIHPDKDTARCRIVTMQGAWLQVYTCHWALKHTSISALSFSSSGLSSCK